MKLYFLLGTICYYIIIAIIKIAVIEVQLHYSFDNSPPKSIRKKDWREELLPMNKSKGVKLE